MYQNAPRAGFARRLAAIIYDSLILAAVMMLAAFFALFFVQILVWIKVVSLAAYPDIAAYLNTGWRKWFYLGYLLAVVVAFYVYFWCKAGQTLGMRAWRMLVVTTDGGPLTRVQAIKRALFALAGFGNLWLWLRWGHGLALQDQLTSTQVIILTKEQSREINLHKTAR